MDSLENMKTDDNGGLGVDSEPLKAILEVICGPEMLMEMIKFPNGVATWNNWMAAILDLMMQPTSKHKPIPFLVTLDFTRGNLRGLNLEGIDLKWVCSGRTDFTGSNLRGAQIGDCARAIFRNADLSRAVISGELTGTDFTDARMDGLILQDECIYGRKSPPVGLTPELMARCRASDGCVEDRVQMEHQIPVKGHVILNEEWR